MNVRHVSLPIHGRLLYHLIALMTVSIWGVTFVSTKILINTGLNPTEIFIYRFLIAYICILAISHKKLWADNLKDEITMCLAGLCGGSLYFIAENTALGMTFASNVSLLICTAPICTMILERILFHAPMRPRMLGGSLIALCGVGFVVFDGTFNLGTNPLGDILTIAAAMLWAMYCIILKVIARRYSTFFISRKVFFYGLLSASLTLLYNQQPIDTSMLLLPEVYSNLLFLGVFASMICYILWNSVVNILGADKAANYIYFVPMMTILTAVTFLAEPFTLFTVVGTTMIIGGVFTAER